MMRINEILISQGSISAIIFACVLFFTSQNRTANSILALLILSLGFNLAHSFFLSEGIYFKHKLLYVLPYGVGFGIGPLLFLYVQSLCTNSRPSYKQLLWFIGDFPHSIYHIFVGENIDNTALHEVLDKFGILSIFLMAYFIWKSSVIIKNYQSGLQDKLSNIEHQRLRWLNQLTRLFLILIPLGLCFWLLLILTGTDFKDRLPVHAFHVVSIFWLGIAGIKQPEIATRISTDIETESSQKQIINPIHLRVLIDCMEKDKLFLLPDLNIRYLEDKLGLTAKQISEALNQGLGKNFYSFINYYRVEEFKRRIKSNDHLTLVGIALECGFNSKTTFQRVFKEITKMRPTEYAQTLVS